MAFPDYLTEFQRGMQAAKSLADTRKSTMYSEDIGSLYQQPMTTPERYQRMLPIMGAYAPEKAVALEQSIYKAQTEGARDKIKNILSVAVPVIKEAVDNGDSAFVSKYTQSLSEQYPELSGVFKGMDGMKAQAKGGTWHLAYNEKTKGIDLYNPAQGRFAGVKAYTSADKPLADDLNDLEDFERLYQKTFNLMSPETAQKTLVNRALRKNIKVPTSYLGGGIPETGTGKKTTGLNLEAIKKQYQKNLDKAK